MGVPDKSDVIKPVKLIGQTHDLVQRKDVLESLHVQRIAVTESDVVLNMNIGYHLQPLQIFMGYLSPCPVEGDSGRLIVKRVVHTTAHGSIMVSEQCYRRLLADQVAARFRIGSIPDDIAETDISVDLLRLEKIQYNVKSFQIGVNIGKYCVSHRLLPLLNQCFNRLDRSMSTSATLS